MYGRLPDVIHFTGFERYDGEDEFPLDMVTLHLDGELKEQIRTAYRFLMSNPFVSSIRIRIDDDKCEFHIDPNRELHEYTEIPDHCDLIILPNCIILDLYDTDTSYLSMVTTSWSSMIHLLPREWERILE
ncbi:MAG: hypothetical protein KatS3mg023_3621 [Armatimonadota bacterium]|nr:MAG: hypothetical protein KatS3mg023_3621 [Armatimonadota bacterium]